jgi:heavy metal sensor kinase
MNRRSIRFRLTVWYALVLAGALTVFALGIGIAMWRSLMHDVDDTLEKRVYSTESFLKAELKEPAVQVSEELGEYADAFPANSMLTVKDEAGSVVFASNRAFPWPPSAHAQSRLRWHEHDYRLLVMTVVPDGRNWTVLVAEPLDSIERLQTRLWALLIGFIPGVIAIAAIGGSWLSRRALKPVDEITAAARTIGIENLSQRLVVPQSGDEFQRLSETWNLMLSRLEGAVKRLRSFTADASHELRTPLAVIRTTAEIACRKTRSAESYRDSLGQIVTESERMTHLVEDLLFLARCDAQILDVPLKPLELGAVSHDVCDLLRPLAEAKGVVLCVEQPERAFQIVANEPSIRRLILIVVDNALKYSGRADEVKIRLTAHEQAVHLVVKDSGPGISEAELPRIFDRFYRSPGVSGNIAGSGLGLALAAEIANHHGATINVVSKAGEGSIFTVVFPAKRD